MSHRRSASMPDRLLVHVDGHAMELSNLDKVLYPAAGFTKGEVIDYYTRISPVLLPHITHRPLTRIRYPNGVTGNGFFEKNAPAGRVGRLRGAGPATPPAGAVSAYAPRAADDRARRYPRQVTSRMAKNLRPGKVFIDWSQNSAAKTTVAPYSLRAEPNPTVS